MKLSAKIAAIEIDGDEVRLAVVKTGGRLPAILEFHRNRAAYSIPEQRPEAMAGAVREVLRKTKVRPAAYVLCASSEKSVVRTLPVPFRGKRRVAAAVRFELEPHLAFPIEEVAVDFAPIRELEGRTDVLVVGVRREFLENDLAILKAAGADPDCINLDALGLTALWARRQKALSGLNAVFHIRPERSILAILYGKRLAYFRHLGVSAAMFHENPGAVAREVLNSLRAFVITWEGEEEIRELTVTGVSPFDDEKALFSERLPMPVSYANLLEGAKGAAAALRSAGSDGAAAGESVAPDAPVPTPSSSANHWESLVGVAATVAGGGYYLNFRKGELGKTGALRSLVRRAAFSLSLGVVVLAGLLTYGIVRYRSNVAELNRIGAEIWSIFAQTFPQSARVKDGRHPQDVGGARTMEFMGEEMGTLAEAPGAFSPEMFSRPTLLDILKDISQRMPDDKVAITEIKITAARKQQIAIAGEEKAPQAFQEAFDNLKQSKLLTVDEVADRRTEGNKTKFTIKASM